MSIEIGRWGERERERERETCFGVEVRNRNTPSDMGKEKLKK